MDVNNHSTDLSIIIPMYNCGDVIERCLTSIDFNDAEIIVVDDGSTDNGAKIVKQYTISHPNVSIISKKNGGVSSARNVGLENAHGKYIMFIDADDFVASGGIEKIIKIAIDDDVDVLKYWAYYISQTDTSFIPEDIRSHKYTKRILSGRAEALNHYDISDYVIWDGLYKRSIIEDNHIRFNESLHLHEDDAFMAEVFCHSNKVVELNLRLYCYTVASPQSSTHNIISSDKLNKLINSAVIAIQYRQSIIKQCLPDEKFPLERYKMMRYVFSCLLTLIESNDNIDTINSYINEFRNLSVYPLEYKWIVVARMKSNKKKMYKYIIKTWVVNHIQVMYRFRLMRLFKYIKQNK